MEQVVGAREEVYDWFNLQIFFAGENSSSKGGKIFERFNRRGLKYILQGRTVVAGENSSSKGGKIFERFNRRGLKYILHSSCNWGSASMWLIQGRPDRRRKATAEGGRSPQENADGNDAADDTNDDGDDALLMILMMMEMMIQMERARLVTVKTLKSPKWILEGL